MRQFCPTPGAKRPQPAQRMDRLRPTLIAGIALFYFSAALTAGAFIYYVRQTRARLRYYNREEYEIRWPRTNWIYYTTALSAVAFGQLYLLQFFGQGFFVKPGADVTLWLRWLFYAVIGSVYMGDLAYVMTQRPHDGQSFFCVLLYAASLVSFFGANVSQENDPRIVWIAHSMFFFLCAVLGLFYPENKMAGPKWAKVKQIIFSEPSVWRVAFRPEGQGQAESSLKIWALAYRVFFLVFVVLSYCGLVVSWFLSDGAGFTHVSDLRVTTITFLVFDLLLIVPFDLLLAALTFAGRTEKFNAVARATGHKRTETPYRA